MLVTADRRLQYQQNIPRFDIGVVVISAHDVRLPSLPRLIPKLREAITDVTQGTVVIVGPTDARE